MKPRPLLAMLLLVLTTVIASAQNYEYHPSLPLHIGVGIDPSNPTRTHRPALAFTDDDIKHIASGPGVSITATQMRTLSQFHSAMDLDTSVDANFLFGGGGAKLSYADQSWFDSSSFTFALRAYSDFGLWEVQPKGLIDDAKAVKTDPATFNRQFGSEYVNAERRAALVVAVFTINNVSQATQDSLRSSINASVSLGFSAEATASYKKTVEQALKVSNISYQFFARGGPGIEKASGTIANLGDFDAVLKNIQSYLQSVNEHNAQPVEFYTRSYGDWGVGETSTVPTANQEALRQDYFAYQSYSSLLSRVDQYLSGADTQYSYLSRIQFEPLRRVQPDLQNLLQQVIDHASSLQHPAQNKQVTASPIRFWPTVSVPFPHLSLTITALARPSPPASIYTDGYITGYALNKVHVLLMGTVIKTFDLIPSNMVPDCQVFSIPTPVGLEIQFRDATGVVVLSYTLPPP